MCVKTTESQVLAMGCEPHWKSYSVIHQVYRKALNMPIPMSSHMFLKLIMISRLPYQEMSYSVVTSSKIGYLIIFIKHIGGLAWCRWMLSAWQLVTYSEWGCTWHLHSSSSSSPSGKANSFSTIICPHQTNISSTTFHTPSYIV